MSSKYLLNKFLLTVDRDPEWVERYRADPAGMVAWWEETQANRILNVPDAEASTWLAFTDEERAALVAHDHVALFGLGAHPFLTLTLFIALFERDEESEPRLYWRGVLVQLMSVERITDFRAQRVARAEARRLQAILMANGQRLLPDSRDRLRRGYNFEPIFARVASAANIDGGGIKHERRHFVLLQIRCAGHEGGADRAMAGIA